jgi:5-methylcytosine-specific restriction endonuclease McrA
MERKAITSRMKIDALLDMAWGARTDHLSIYCLECYEPIQPCEAIQWDHRHATVHKGPHTYQNIRPVHTECHKRKTKRDVQANAKVKRIRGETCTRKGPPIKSRGFDKRFTKRMSGTIERRNT